jgi:hypothetical protein
MKTYFAYLFALFSVYLLIVSCESKVIFYEINEEAEPFLAYEIGDVIQILNGYEDENTNFTVTEKVYNCLAYKELDDISMGVKDYYEKGDLIFTNNLDCLGKISVRGAKNNSCDVFISFSNCYNELTFTSPEYHETLKINEELYSDVYVFNAINQSCSSKSKLYFSNEIGFLLLNV